MKESIELHTIGTFRGKEYEMQDLLNGLLEENIRLNNIINKVTKYIEGGCEGHDYYEYDYILDILKGDDKE